MNNAATVAAALIETKAINYRTGNAARADLKKIARDLYAATGYNFAAAVDIAEEACAAAKMSPITVNMMINFFA